MRIFLSGQLQLTYLSAADGERQALFCHNSM